MSDRRHRDPIPIPDDSGSKLDVVRSNSELNPATADTSDYQPGSGMGAVVVHHLVTAILIAGVLAAGVWGYLTFKNADFLKEQPKRPTPLEGPALSSQVDRLHFALGVYFAIYDKYPATLESLVDEGLLSTSDLAYPRGSSTILYQRLGDTYQLTVERMVERAVEETEPEEAGSPSPAGTNGGSEESVESDDTAEPVRTSTCPLSSRTGGP